MKTPLHYYQSLIQTDHGHFIHDFHSVYATWRQIEAMAVVGKTLGKFLTVVIFSLPNWETYLNTRGHSLAFFISSMKGNHSVSTQNDYNCYIPICKFYLLDFIRFIYANFSNLSRKILVNFRR